MQQSISFSEVTDYSLDLKSSGLVLRIKQGSKITDIVVSEDAPAQAIVKASAFKSTHGKSRTRAHNSYWKPGEAKLNEQKVTEIRQLWADAVLEHGSPTAATRALGKMYDCSAANVSLIVKRKTWTHV
jgi:hypothetical protein